MPNVELVRLDPELEASLVNNPAYFEAMMEENWARVAELVHQLVGRKFTAVPLRVNKLEWGGYFVVDSETRDVVGSCAFKGEPNENGDVEIAYFTYPDFEGKGYATQMAQKLVDLAINGSSVNRVIAHTLPQKNASTRVLEKAQMRFVGEVTDPEDGQVWQWEYCLQESDSK